MDDSELLTIKQVMDKVDKLSLELEEDLTITKSKNHLIVFNDAGGIEIYFARIVKGHNVFYYET